MFFVGSFQDVFNPFQAGIVGLVVLGPGLVVLAAVSEPFDFTDFRPVGRQKQQPQTTHVAFAHDMSFVDAGVIENGRA